MIEIVVPILFSFWMCVTYVVYAMVMIAIWICIGLLGGPCMYLKPPKAPPIPSLPDFKESR